MSVHSMPQEKVCEFLMDREDFVDMVCNAIACNDPINIDEIKDN